MDCRSRSPRSSGEGDATTSTSVASAALIQVSSTLDSANTATGRSVALTERTALRAEEIRHLPDGQALVIYRNTPAMIIDLIAWTHRPDGAEITAGIGRVRAARDQGTTFHG